MSRAAGWPVEGLDGVTRLHALIAQFVPDEWGALDPADAAWRVKVGIETDRGQWVQAFRPRSERPGEVDLGHRLAHCCRPGGRPRTGNFIGRVQRDARPSTRRRTGYSQ